MGDVVKMLDYPRAVAAADRALEAILEPLQNPDGSFDWYCTPADDGQLGPFDKAGIAFGKWLHEHPAISHVLQAEVGFEEIMFESYIETHSKKFEYVVRGDETAGRVIRRPA